MLEERKEDRTAGARELWVLWAAYNFRGPIKPLPAAMNDK